MLRFTTVIYKQIPTTRMLSSTYSLTNEELCIKFRKLEIQVTTLQDKINRLTNKVNYDIIHTTKAPKLSKIRAVKAGL